MSSSGYAHVVGAISSQVGRQDDDVRGVFTAIHTTLICFPTHAVYALGTLVERRAKSDGDEMLKKATVTVRWNFFGAALTKQA